MKTPRAGGKSAIKVALSPRSLKPCELAVAKAVSTPRRKGYSKGARPRVLGARTVPGLAATHGRALVASVRVKEEASPS